MDILVAFFMGAFGGVVTTLFILGASMGSRECEAYMEGYMEGYLAGKNE